MTFEVFFDTTVFFALIRVCASSVTQLHIQCRSYKKLKWETEKIRSDIKQYLTSGLNKKKERVV